MPDILPTDVADLEPFADWAIQAFYDAAFPRLEDAMAYLDRFTLDELPEDAMRLL